MTGDLRYEEVEVGASVPGLVKHPTSMQLVRFACLTEKFYEVHYDKDFALRQGLPGVLVQGELVVSFLVQMLTDWAGSAGHVRKYHFSFLRPVLVNEDVICRGKVTASYASGDRRYLECELWAENQKQEITVSGKAVLVCR